MEQNRIDPTLLRGLTQPRLSRRQLFRSAGIGLGGLALSQVLAACGVDEPAESGDRGFDWSKQKKTGTVAFGNWPLYIDVAKEGGERVHPSLQLFTQETGIEVEYREAINDYASFFGKLQPQLAAGRSTGFDLIVMGFPRWLPQMIRLGYLLPLDQSRLGNFQRYAAPKYQDPTYDPGNRYSIAYQSGITGIGYNPELTGREITSVMDLFDPAFEGKVGMFGDTEDTPNLTLLGMGVEPVDSTPGDWDQAAELLRNQRDQAIVRQYYGQNYIGNLQRGNVALTMAWSADVLQAQLSGSPELRFVIPDEGALLWTDSMVILKGAEHPLDAITFMDFLYRPDVAAMIVDYIQNVTPVPQAQEVLRDQGSDVADSEFSFPSEETYAQLHGYRILEPEEQQSWDDLFLSVYQG